MSYFLGYRYHGVGVDMGALIIGENRQGVIVLTVRE